MVVPSRQFRPRCCFPSRFPSRPCCVPLLLSLPARRRSLFLLTIKFVLCDQNSIQVDISSAGLQNNTIEQNSNITDNVIGDPFEKIADDENDENDEDAPPYWESTETFDRGIYGIESEVILLDDARDEEDLQMIDDVLAVPLG